MLTRLKEISLQHLAPGSAEFFAQQKALIFTRPLLKRCYDDWYGRLLADIRSVPDKGLIVELGSGGSYLKALEPSTITSDVLEGVADRVIDARKLPFPNRSVRALVLTHVLHHVPDVEAFFGEAQRVLVPGGVITMIEVAHTAFARFFFKNFHHEPYLDQRREWSFDQQDTMMDSNQALKIECLAFTPWLIYLASGGVTMRDVVPRFLTGPLLAIEWLLTPLRALFALHWHIRLRKIA